jgi:hypothetical protein
VIKSNPMYNDDTEILFPSRIIPSLKGMHGKEWDQLLDRVIHNGPDSKDHIAFILMMVKLGGCATCNADSFRAMKGCTQCAKQTIRRFRGDDQELHKFYQDALVETEVYFATAKV